ncbi:MAG: helix-turn-helix transcriptional regulator [Candidatus Woesearchaeota archaeon]
MKRKKLIELREKRNLTQKAVVNKLKKQYDVNITASFYGMIERGERNPTLKLAKKIADFFNTSVEEIFFSSANNSMLNNENTA